MAAKLIGKLAGEMLERKVNGMILGVDENVVDLAIIQSSTLYQDEAALMTLAMAVQAICKQHHFRVNEALDFIERVINGESTEDAWAALERQAEGSQDWRETGPTNPDAGPWHSDTDQGHF